MKKTIPLDKKRPQSYRALVNPDKLFVGANRLFLLKTSLISEESCHARPIPATGVWYLRPHGNPATFLNQVKTVIYARSNNGVFWLFAGISLSFL
jgi:hypothetical protein